MFGWGRSYTTGQSVLYFGGLYEIRSGAETIHIFAGSQRLASVFADGRTQFYHPNHLGSASFITDGNGNPKEKIEYFPFGTYRAVGDPNGTYDYDPNFPDVFYTFTGQEDDDDLGLYNYGARLYDPVLGRFISPDRLVPEPGNLQAFNRYTYCLNNPLIYTDPSGEFFGIDDLIIGIVVSVVLVSSSTMGAYQAKRSGQNVYAGAFLGGIRSLVSFNPMGAIFEGSMSGAIQARQSGKNPWAGAMLGGSVSAASYGINQYSGGSILGTFLSGAFSGAAYSAAYHENVWKGALYGGLTSVAIAGTTYGAIALAESIFGSGNTPSGQGAENNGRGGGDPKELEKVLAENNVYEVAQVDNQPEFRVDPWPEYLKNCGVWVQTGPTKQGMFFCACYLECVTVSGRVLKSKEEPGVSGAMWGTGKGCYCESRGRVCCVGQND